MSQRGDVPRLAKQCTFVSSFSSLFIGQPVAQTCDSTSPRWTCRKGRTRDPKAGKSEGRNRAAKRSAFYEAMKIYRGHFEPLLTNELEAEQLAVLEKRSMDRSRDKRLARQFTLRDLLAVKKKRLFSLNVYSLISKTGSGGLPLAHEFSKGDLIRLTPDRSSDDERVVEGTVLAKHASHLLVTVPLGSEGALQMDTFVDQRELLRADCGTSSVAFERALSALISFTTEGPSAADIAKLVVMSLAEVNELDSRRMNGTYIGKNGSLYIEKEPQDLHRNSDNGDNDFEYKWQSFSKETVSKIDQQDMARVLRDLPDSLNSSQVAAIKVSLRRRLTLIQGPPGTGKTITTAHMICCCVKLGLGPVLACAASNVAADNLMRKIVHAAPSRLRIVRIGRVPAIGEDLWDKTLESRLEQDPLLRKAREDCAAGSLKFSDLLDIEKGIVKRTLEKADVVVGTCVACGRDALQELKFRFVVVDEATQASEPDVLIPLSIMINNGSQAQLILVGDQHQLPPTILSRNQDQTLGMGLETSLFVRLWRNGIDTQLLNVQYRMHPNISVFPSSHFYFKRLRDGIGSEDRPLPTLFATRRADSILVKSRTLFLNVPEGQEETDSKSTDIVTVRHSYRNRTEANVILMLLHELLNAGGGVMESMQAFSPFDIGLITPYAGQVRLLKELLAKQERSSSVEVSTVDGFQGREKNVIVLSGVRSNDKGEVGFLRDWRRLNVAITRARALLIVVGNGNTLSADPHWRSWIKWVRRYGTTAEISNTADGQNIFS